MTAGKKDAPFLIATKIQDTQMINWMRNTQEV